MRRGNQTGNLCTRMYHASANIAASPEAAVHLCGTVLQLEQSIAELRSSVETLNKCVEFGVDDGQFFLNRLELGCGSIKTKSSCWALRIESALSKSSHFGLRIFTNETVTTIDRFFSIRTKWDFADVAAFIAGGLVPFRRRVEWAARGTAHGA